MRTKRKLHSICYYIFKYICICIPLIMLLLSYVFMNKTIQNTYALEETTTTQEIQYKYQTNELNSVNDIVVGNIYYVNLGNSTIGNEGYAFSFYTTYIKFNENFEIDEDRYLYFYIEDNLYFYDDYLILIDTDNYIEYYYYNTNTYIDVSISQELQYINSFSIIILSDEYLATATRLYNDGFLNICPNEYIPYDTITNITNNTYNADALTPLSSIENREVNLSYIEPIESFYSLGVNSFYDSLLEVVGIDTDDRVTLYLLHMPLWLLWVELLYLVASILALVPRIFNKWFDFEE